MRDRPRRPRLQPTDLGAATGLLGLAVLAGCGEAPEAGSVAGERPTDVATPTQSPSEPAGEEPSAEHPPAIGDLPPTATQASREGVRAFTDHVVNLFEHGYRFGDVAPLREACLESCTLCHEYADEYESSTAVGGWVSGEATWRVDNLRIGEFASDHAVVETAITIGEHEYADSAVDEPTAAPERTYAFTFELSYSDGVWHVADAQLA